MSNEVRKYVKITTKVWNQILRDLREMGNLTAAAAKSGTSKQAVYAHVKNHPHKQEQLEIARGEAQVKIEEEIHRRAIEGTEEPIYYQGELVGYTRRYSDKMLELLAKANMRDRYGDTRNVNVNGTVSVEHKAKDKLASLLGVVEDSGEVIDGEYDEVEQIEDQSE